MTEQQSELHNLRELLKATEAHLQEFCDSLGKERVARMQAEGQRDQLRADLDSALTEHGKTADSLVKATVTIRTLQNEVERLQAAGGQGVEPVYQALLSDVNCWADVKKYMHDRWAKSGDVTVRTLYAHPPAAPALVPLTHESIAPVRRFLADRAVYLSDDTVKALISCAHGIGLTVGGDGDGSTP